jgi:hypothetical protein
MGEPELRKLLSLITASLLLLAAQPGRAQAPQNAPVDQGLYVTRQDCKNLVAHHPDPGVAYKPGTDVHGKYVAPADLPGQQSFALPDKIEFDLRLNPLAYAPQQGNAPSGALSNTNVNLGHVEVDLLSGQAKLNGHALEDEQTRIVTEACRKAGYR